MNTSMMIMVAKTMEPWISRVAFMHHLQGRFLVVFRQLQVQAQAPQDVLHDNDGVVHQGPQCDRHAAQGHGIDGAAEALEDQDSGHQGERDGQQGDQGGAAAGQEQQHDYHHQNRAVAQRLQQIVDRHRDEVGLAKDMAFDLHACRQRLLDFGNHQVQSLSQLQGIGAGLLLDTQHHRRLAVMAAVPRTNAGPTFTSAS